MLAPALHPEETLRLAELERMCLLDSAPDPRLDRITRLTQRVFGTAIVLVSLVARERQWFLSRQGLAAQQTGRDVSFCGHAILGVGGLVVEDAAADPRFADNPLVLGPPHIRFYAGVPLHGPTGRPVGTLCLIDPAPRRFDAAELQLLRELGELAEAALADSRRAAQVSQAQLDAIFANVQDGIATTDAAGRIDSMNPAALRMFGYGIPQVLGRDLRQLLAPPGVVALEQLSDGAERQGQRADGSVFRLILTLTPVTSPGYQGYVALLRDPGQMPCGAAAPLPAMPPPLAGPVPVLLASADPEVSGAVEAVLANWGWPCVRAGDAAAALALLRGEGAVALLLIDLTSIGSVGLALAQAAKERLAPERRPLVLGMVSQAARAMLLRAEAAAIDAELPMPVTPDSLHAAVQRASAAAPPAPRGPHYRLDAEILLVESNPINQLVASNILRQAGARVHLAAGGAEALALLRAAPQRYQLVLMALQMPGLDGVSATRAIRQELRLAVPVLAMTAALEREGARCMDAGIDDLIAKPLQQEPMLRTIARYLPGAGAAVEPPATHSAAPDELGDFDISQLLSVDDDPAGRAALAALAVRILDDAGPSFETARAAWRSGNRGQARAALHTLRGTIGTLGAARFSALARALESALADEVASSPESLESLFERSGQALAVSLAAGAAWLSAQSGQPGVDAGQA